MSDRALAYRRLLWIGAILFVAGIVRDLVWHATNDEFEGTAQQFEAHWLLWIGFAVVLVALALAFLRLEASERDPGFTIVAAAAAVYLPVTVWHFIAHANEVDPAVAHVMLGIGDAAIITGALATFLPWLRARLGARGEA